MTSKAKKKTVKPSAAKRSRGRPGYNPTDQFRQIVELHTGLGTPQELICELVGLKDPKTLRKYYAREIDQGEMRLVARGGETLVRMALGAPARFDEKGNCLREEQKPTLGALVFFLKCRGGWKERDVWDGVGGQRPAATGAAEPKKSGKKQQQQEAADRALAGNNGEWGDDLKPGFSKH